MLTGADAARRSVGLFFLVLACVLVIWGETLLKPYLSGAGFLIFWTMCFACLGAAIVTALIDISIMRRRIRLQHEQLVKRTLMELELEQSEMRDQTPKDAQD